MTKADLAEKLAGTTDYNRAHRYISRAWDIGFGVGVFIGIIGGSAIAATICWILWGTP
jgi:hypothetical protein